MKSSFSHLPALCATMAHFNGHLQLYHKGMMEQRSRLNPIFFFLSWKGETSSHDQLKEIKLYDASCMIYYSIM